MDKKRRTATEATESIEAATEAAGVNTTTPVDVAAMKKMVTDFQEGMQMVLEGYSRVFSALAGMKVESVANTSTVPGDSVENHAAIDATSTPDAEKSEKQEKISKAPEETKSSKKSKKSDSNHEEEKVEARTEAPKEENTETTDASSTISYDDLKRVVIAKIEQKQENNQKIGELVKKYGVKNIGELDAKQREAFMSELAAI